MPIRDDQEFMLPLLMIDHVIGVATARTYTIKRFDSDYFVEDNG